MFINQNSNLKPKIKLGLLFNLPLVPILSPTEFLVVCIVYDLRSPFRMSNIIVCVLLFPFHVFHRSLVWKGRHYCVSMQSIGFPHECLGCRKENMAPVTLGLLIGRWKNRQIAPSVIFYCVKRSVTILCRSKCTVAEHECSYG